MINFKKKFVKKKKKKRNNKLIIFKNSFQYFLKTHSNIARIKEKF